MMKELQKKLNITQQDLKHTISKNLNICWMAKPVKFKNINGQIIDLCQITYIVQISNGGWIPQWAVEMGLIDQHMIAIYKQITKWLNLKKKNERERELNMIR